MRLLVLLFIPALLLAQSARFEQGDFHGRDAYFLENAKMRVAALRGAGHLAEIRLKSDDPRIAVNPMRIPHYATIEPWAYDPAKHDDLYGGGTNRILMSGYMGHLLNFPTFGPPSASETANGMGNHGEALTQEWKLDRSEVDDESVVVWYSAHLPKTHYNVGRALTLPSDEQVLYIEEWVESLVDYDRPAMWVQHVTFGPPFVEPGKTTLDMSAKRGEVRRGGEDTDSLAQGAVVWPDGKAWDGKAADLRVMQPKAHAGTYAGYEMDPARERAWFTMFHPDYRALIGYVWHTADFPFMGDWQENGRNTQLPWQGKAKARGMELGTTPFGGPMQAVISEGEFLGKPVVRWIPGRQRQTVRYIAFVVQIPEGYEGVEDVTIHDGRIEIIERNTGKRTTLKSERKW
ncbi:MAG: hypothetical protein H6509_00180 [Bryobacterales bacterium]|nr:hypothetical protein [Bryobacterales bacterium]